jgi:hypothetical protein
MVTPFRPKDGDVWENLIEFALARCVDRSDVAGAVVPAVEAGDPAADRRGRIPGKRTIPRPEGERTEGFVAV